MSVILLYGGLAAIFLGLALAVGLIAVGHRATAVQRSIAAIDQAYSPAATGLGEGGRPGPGPTTISGVAGNVARVLTPTPTASWIQRQLDYAGNPPTWPVSRVNEAQGIAAFALAFIGLLLGSAGGLAGALTGLALGGLAGLGAPLLVVYDLANRRQDKLRRDLPDALDLLTLSVEAGQGFDAALALISGRMTGPLSREIARALHETQMGMRRNDAIRGMGARTSVAELRSFCTAVVQASELGIPIANVLREQAQEMRLKRRQRADEQARKIPVKIVIPLVMLLLPAIFIVVLGPAVLQITSNGFLGH
jgi:tight adherence protein C